MMVSCLRLTANVALFAMWSVAVTASPINSVIDRISGHDTAGAQLVAAMMREMDINNRNQETFKEDFDAAMTQFKTEYNIVGENKLQTKNDTNDEIVCPDHEEQLGKLNNDLMTQWEKVDAALTAKKELLEKIRELLEDDADDAQGLHCGENKSEGAEELCALLDKLEGDREAEREILEKEKAILDDFIANIGQYVCDCKMTPWGDWSECAGGSVQPTTVWENCNANEKEDSETNTGCQVDAKCGNGTQFVTRKQVWPKKNGGQDCDGSTTQKVGDEENVVGDLGELGAETNTQNFTRDCSEGKNQAWNGACPVACEWGNWIGDFTDHACDVDSCMDGDEKASNFRTITREKVKGKAYGGKPCFATQEGEDGPLLTNTKHETCYFEDAAAYDYGKLEHEKSKIETKAGKLIKEMCKGENGPCQNDSECNVVYSPDSETVTSWCQCKDGFTGDWCEKATWIHAEESRTFDGDEVETITKLDDREYTVAECKDICTKTAKCDGFRIEISGPREGHCTLVDIFSPDFFDVGSQVWDHFEIYYIDDATRLST